MALWSKLFGGKQTPPTPQPNQLGRIPAAQLQRRAVLEEPAYDFDVAERTRAVQATVQDNETDANAQAALAAGLTLAGDLDGALKAWNFAIFHASDTVLVRRCYLVKGTSLDLDLNRPEKAHQHYQASLKLDPRAAPVRVYLAEMALRSGDSRAFHRLLGELEGQELPSVLLDALAAMHGQDHGTAFEAIQLHHHMEHLKLLRGTSE